MLYLAQTDTTVGFLSSQKQPIINAKKRAQDKPILQVVSSLKKLNDELRVPQAFKNRIRRMQKCSFIYPQGACIRVIHNKRHKEFIERFHKLYSSSANLSGHSFCIDYALSMADIIVYEKGIEFTQSNPSQIFKINKQKICKIR